VKATATVETGSERRRDDEALKRGGRWWRSLAAVACASRPAASAHSGRSVPFTTRRRRASSSTSATRRPAFHCFGAARRTATSSTFVRLRERLSFADACARLAGPIAPPAQPVERSRAGDRHARRWDRLTLEEQVVMNTACALYHHALWRTPVAWPTSAGVASPIGSSATARWATPTALVGGLLRRRSGLRVAQALGLLRAPGRGDGARPLRRVPRRPARRAGAARRAVHLADRPRSGGRRESSPLPGPTGRASRPGFERAAGRRVAYLCEASSTTSPRSLGACRLQPLRHLPAGRAAGLSRQGPHRLRRPRRRRRRPAAAERFGEQLGERFRPLHLPDGSDSNYTRAVIPVGRTAIFPPARRRPPAGAGVALGSIAATEERSPQARPPEDDACRLNAAVS
jgi:hypothetical protein